MSESERLDRAIARVVRRQNCSGCGACTLLDPGLVMKLDPEGFRRPDRRTRNRLPQGSTRLFKEICPGVRVAAQKPAGSVRHPVLGPVVSAWEAWAGDDELRYRGSSGGALSALTAWLTESGEVPRFTAAGPDARDPRKTSGMLITDRHTAGRAAGSRYAPVSVLAVSGVMARGGIVGKPCEISAARALQAQRRDQQDSESGRDDEPLLLSFFCAGTPSQHATERLVSRLGVAPSEPLAALRYRGRGWPGRFVARTQSGHEVSADYDESWGAHLGPHVQWRCRICPDGVGESADISAADYWRADSRGYPTFIEGAGRSALLARTARGHDVLQRAFATGALVGARLDVEALADVQPLQVNRRSTLLGRLSGAFLAGRVGPRFRGFGLTRLASKRARANAVTARGTYRRVRQRHRP